VIDKKINSLKDLRFGQMNPLKDSIGRKSFDPSRVRVTSTLQGSNIDYFTGDLLKGKCQWNAIVLRTTVQNRPYITSNFERTMASFSKSPPAQAHYTYKIFIAELDGFRKLPTKFTEDADNNLINICRDAVAPIGKSWGILDYGTPVEVVFDNQEKGIIATIVDVQHNKRIPLQGEKSSAGLFKNVVSTPSAPRQVRLVGQSGNHEPKRIGAGLKLNYSEIESISHLFKPVLDVIGTTEAGAAQYDAGNYKVSANNYRSIRMSTRLFGGTNIGSVKVSQIQSQQDKGRTNLFAAGRYQIIPDTMKLIIPVVAADYPGGTDAIKDKYYGAETQDILGTALIMWKQGRAGMFFAGRHDDAEGAAQSIAYEWAGIPIQYDEYHEGAGNLERGQSWWSGTGGNKAHSKYITPILDAVHTVRQNLDKDSTAGQIFGTLSA